MSEAALKLPARESSAPPAVAAAVDLGFAAALLFFLSGAASLLLETAAVRAFLELFGSTAASLGAVGGAFLACLAIGAFAVGPLADRSKRPLAVYALLEATACLGALGVLLLLPRLDGLATAFAASEARGESSLGARLLACVALLIVPVGALGATLPLLARVRELSRTRGAAAGGLQVASTLGGMVGALAGATVLLGVLGTRGTWATAAGVNGLVAIGAWLLSRRVPAIAPAGEAPSTALEPAAAAASRARSDDAGSSPVLPLLLASFLTGFAVLALEVLLFRGLGQTARGSQDTLGVLLASFLGASALGSAVGVALARGRARAGFVLGQSLSVVTPLVALAFLRAMAGDRIHFGAAATSWSGRLAQELLGALMVAGPAAFATAISFPCACELARAPRFGRLVALLSGAWTAGAALAGVVTPLLLPRLGLRLELLAVAGLPLLGLGLVVVGDRALLAGRRVAWLGGSLVLALALLFLGPGGRWDAPLVFFHRVAGAPGSQLLDYREDPIANVAVVRRFDGERVLGMNDQLALGGSDAARVEMTQGILPALLHPAPARALALGVGTGATVAGMRQFGCKHVDAVELIPSVLDMLPWFAAENGAIVLDPGVGFVATDARAFVRTAPPESYDLIVGDLFFPWESEAGLLYTREHFERVKRLLAPGGIFCQWLPGHQLRWEEIGLVGRTFCEVFDGATVWLAGPDFPFPLLGLVASTERLELDVPKLAARLEQHPAKELLSRLGLAEAKDFLSLYVADEWFFRDQFEEKAINTADRARVEFSAARRVESDNVVALINRRRLFETHEDVVFRMTQSSIDKKQLVELKRELSGAAQAMWQLFDARTSLLLAAANRDLPPDARRNDPAELEAHAFQVVGALMRDRPDHAGAAEVMLALLSDQLRLRQYERVVQGVITLEAEPRIGALPRLRYLRGLAFLSAVCDPDPQQAALFTKPLEFAIKDFRKAAELDPKMVEARVQLGIALFLEGSPEAREEARAVLREAREKIVAPERPDGHGLPAPAEGVLALLEGRPEAAQQWLARPESQRYAAKIAAAVTGK